MNTLINNTQSFLSFLLEDEVFAIEVTRVLEIVENKKITKVPHAPECILGVINLRGQVLPILDLRKKFGLPDPENTQETCIIILNVAAEEEKVTLGVKVDEVKEVLEIVPSDIQPLPNLGAMYSSKVLSGIFKKEESFIMVLNADKIFSLNEIENLSELEI